MGESANCGTGILAVGRFECQRETNADRCAGLRRTAPGRAMYPPAMGSRPWLTIVRAASVVLVLAAITAQAVVLAQNDRFDPGRFFAFFTIQSNIIGVAAYLWLLRVGAGTRSRALELLRGAAAVYLTVTF